MATPAAPVRSDANASVPCTYENRYLNHLCRTHVPELDGDAVDLSRRASKLFPFSARKETKDACGLRPRGKERGGRRWHDCGDLIGGSRLEGIRLVVGVTSSPDKWGRRRRDGIRRTWFTYPAIGRSVIACFVVGRAGVKPARLTALDAEADELGDVLFLPHVRDGDGPFVTISKAHAWFRLATESLGMLSRGETARSDGPPRQVIGGYPAIEAHGVRHIAKVDDDTYLHLPQLQRDLDGMHCRRHLYYGSFAYAGYNPMTFLKCGFDYGATGGRYRKYGCANRTRGASHPPFPWTTGAMMLASTSLIVRIAAEPAIGAFVERSKLNHAAHGRVRSTDEDVAMGFYISRFHLAGLASVTYVRVNERLPNLGCTRNRGLYQPPRNRSVGMHFVKSAGGMEYVWSVIHDGMPPNATRCIQMNGDGRL